jgi:endonuclease YncB( thermonuclease family)
MKLRAPLRLRSLILIVASLAFLDAEAGAGCPAVGGESAVVASVTERGEVMLADGRAVRLAGIDIPDASRGEPESAATARAWLSSRLVGREVALHLLSARTDRWGRWLADISVTGQGAPVLISLELLSAGLARVRPEIEARNCLAERLAAEDAARDDGLGLWTDPYYGVVAATDLEDLRQRDGQFAIVEGVVLRVGTSRDRTWLDFGRRGGFSAVVTAR